MMWRITGTPSLRRSWWHLLSSPLLSLHRLQLHCYLLSELSLTTTVATSPDPSTPSSRSHRTRTSSTRSLHRCRENAELKRPGNFIDIHGLKKSRQLHRHSRSTTAAATATRTTCSSRSSTWGISPTFLATMDARRRCHRGCTEVSPTGSERYSVGVMITWQFISWDFFPFSVALNSVSRDEMSGLEMQYNWDRSWPWDCVMETGNEMYVSVGVVSKTGRFQLLFQWSEVMKLAWPVESWGKRKRKHTGGGLPIYQQGGSESAVYGPRKQYRIDTDRF